MIPWITAIWSGLSRGKRESSTALTSEKVFSAANVPVDMKNTKESHNITGSQRLMRSCEVLDIVAIS